MRWEQGRRSENVEDRRGSRAAASMGGGAIGCGSIVVGLIYLALGGDPRTAMQIVAAGQQAAQSAPVANTAPSKADDELAAFVSVVLGSTEDVWGKLFAAQGARYTPPKLVLFTGKVDSACGRTSASVGPFYCPGDQKAYIDLSFYRELKSQLGAPGDFAQAYVIAHEIGHHIQNLLGTSEKVARKEHAAKSEAEANSWSVKLELQADCYAGVWAHHAENQLHWLENGDIGEAMTAAKAIGDDTLQKAGQGYVVPESFTHGSSADRMRWFKAGMDSGQIAACDTFGGK